MSITHIGVTGNRPGIKKASEVFPHGSQKATQSLRPFVGRMKPGAVIAASGILLHLILRFILHATQTISLVPLFLVLLTAGVPLLIGLSRRLLVREFGSDLLAGVSIVTSVLLGEYLVGSIVVLMLSGGTSLEEYASRRASSVLDALARRMPQSAHRKDGLRTLDIPLSEIAIEDLLVVFPHEVCPADGVVVEGHGRMNEAYLTGEPFEIAKTPGSPVLSGAINGETAMTIRAEKKSVDSRYARIMRVMEDTQQRRPRLRRLGDHLGAWYTPIAVSVALLAVAATGNWSRFLAVLVIATPCPLLIAIPVAVIGAISLAARRGIIIKNPAILEQLDSCRTFIFDKTGTLTYGNPSLEEIVCAPGFEECQVLRLAASVERYSKHPLAGAILRAAEGRGLALNSATEIREPAGEGLRGIVEGRKIVITGRAKLSQEQVTLPPASPGLECLVLIDGALAGALNFRDAPRKDSRVFLEHLVPSHHARKVILVSGDRDTEVRYLAAQLNIGEVHAAKSPEDKVAIVRAETESEKTLFVGDGINDAPAMQAATVGVAFGTTSDITSEAGDAVILEPSLGKVDELIHIGRRMRRIALESAIGGMTLSILGMLLAALGLLAPLAGAVAQEVIDLAAVLNAVRVVFPREQLQDFSSFS
jgi:heavy metal translocating P-type ATPase